MGQTKILTINVDFNANQGVGVYNTKFPMESGYNKATGIAVIQTGVHAKFDIGVNDHGNNTKLDPAHISFWAPGVNGDQKFIPIDIELSNNHLILITNVRVSEANAIGYQVVLRIEK